MIVYGSEYSYFTGKFEAYLRFKEISYERRPLGVSMYSWKLPRLLGGAQLPTVQLPDGRWMTDTTPMIAWLEEQHPEPAVIPADPLQRFVALLIEDFGDEWLWRPAMHYRWSYAAGPAAALAAGSPASSSGCRCRWRCGGAGSPAASAACS